MMKRVRIITTLLLTGIMSISLLTGCSGKNDKTGENAQTKEAAADSTWPSETVTLYVPASAGGGTDVSARALSSAISENTGSSVVVMNQTTGNGTVAYETVREANTNGTELLYYHPNLFLSYYTGVYDKSPLENFTPISVFAFLEAQAIVVSKDSPYNNLEELVEGCREKPLVAGVQNGGFDQLIIGLLAKDAGVEFKQVESGSETDRVTALLGGNTDVAVLTANLAAQYEETGDMKVLSVASSERSQNYPDYPTAKESGYENTIFDVAFLILGPAGMDESLVEAMNTEIAKAADNDFINEYLSTSGSELALYDISDTKKYVEELDSKIQGVLEK